MKILKDRRGSMSVLFIGIAFALAALAMLVMECAAVYSNYDYAESVLSRSCTCAVEKNTDDTYRADRILVLDTEAAETDFRLYAASDMPERFTVSIDSVNATETPPRLEALGTVSFPTMFSAFGTGGVTMKFKVASENNRLE